MNGDIERSFDGKTSQLLSVEPDRSVVEGAFAVLASRLRLQILQALGENEEKAYSFTELYDAVDADNTYQFSYHLSELAGRYVQQIDEGYVISDAGARIIQSVNAGEYTVRPEFDPVCVSTYCPYCGETTAEATYDGRLATVDCRSCGFTLLRYDLRPAHVATRNSREALIAADRQIRAEYGSALAGVCQRCGGSIDSKFITGERAEPATALFVCDCVHCGTTLSSPVEIALIHHPEVSSRYWAEGIDTSTTPIWELFSLLSEWEVEIDDSGKICVQTGTHRFTTDRESVGRTVSDRQPFHDRWTAELAE